MARKEFNDVDIRVEFNETANRQQIASGDNVNTLFGKIRRWLSDLKLVAFSGSYDDLENKPAIPTKTSQLTNDSGFAVPGSKAGIWTDNEGGNMYVSSLDGTRWEMDALSGGLRIFTYANNIKMGILIDKNGVVTFPNTPSKITNSLIATVPGNALDAVQGKVLDEKGSQINVYKGADGNLHFRNWAGADTVIPFSPTLSDPLHLKFSFTATAYPSIPTFSKDIELTIKCASDLKINVYGSNVIDFAVANSVLIGQYPAGTYYLNSKNYKYIIVRYGSGTGKTFDILAKWL